MALPTFVAAGAARSGSTAVIEGLRRHPDVFVTQPKEPHYFAFAGHPVEFTGPGDAETINQVAVTGTAAHLRLYPGDSGAYRALGEGSVSTLYYAERSISAIRRLGADMRVVLLLREPAARAWSSHQYLRVRGYEPVVDFLQAVGLEAERVSANWHHLWHYTRMSRYAESVGAFLAAFGPERVRVWLYEDLQRNYGTLVDDVLAFVGVAPARSLGGGATRANVSGSARHAGAQKAMHGAPRQPALKVSLKRVVPFGIRERIRSANLQAVGAPESVHRSLGPRFASDVSALANLLGRPLTEWRK